MPILNIQIASIVFPNDSPQNRNSHKSSNSNANLTKSKHPEITKTTNTNTKFNACFAKNSPFELNRPAVYACNLSVACSYLSNIPIITLPYVYIIILYYLLNY